MGPVEARTTRPPSLARVLALRAHQVFSGLFFEPVALLRKWAELPLFVRNLQQYRSRQDTTNPNFRLKLRYLYPSPGERRAAAGTARGHYFHQDLYIAREIFRLAPARHVDVGSSLAGFIAHLLSFREVGYIDIRPVRSTVAGLQYIHGSMLDMPFEDAEVESVSALHSPEHVGLGRYGDPVEPDAWRQAIGELQRVLRPGGRLYFSVPIGKERVEFDAHRVFNTATVLAAFDQLQLVRFAFVDDSGDLHTDADPSATDLWYGCGIFTFTKDAR